MKKSIVAIMMAVTLVGSSLAFPVQAYAQDVNQGEVLEVNEGDIDTNDGTITTNHGTVDGNGGTVTYNDGTVTTNYRGATVTTNDGDVSLNDGTVTTNNGDIATNYYSGTVTTNDASGTIFVNQGTVTTNDGDVLGNSGTVTTNNGSVDTNTGIVKNNFGTVTKNKGTVENNFGTVTKNKGTVENNFGGTVNNEDGGTVTNQWYEYILTGGIFKSGSTASKDAGDKTWIGKAEAPDNELGDYYITVAANEGAVFEYATVNGEPVSYITNADGTISFGNISSAISIFFKQLINNSNNNNDNETSADSDGANLIAAIEAVIAAEEKMPVTSFTSDEAVAKIPATAKSAGASYNLSAITTSQGFVAAVNKISENVKAQNAANNVANNTARRTSVTIYSDKPMNFTADILNAISASDIDFVFVFMHNGKMYRVTIPRGTVIDFSGHVYEGPLFIGQILGTTEVIG